MPNQNKNNFDDTGHKLEAIGSWDHGVEPFDAGSCPKYGDETLRETLGRWVRRVWFGGGLLNDRELREDYRGHTEEVVAGEKMAVSSVVHRNSFEAPC